MCRLGDQARVGCGGAHQRRQPGFNQRTGLGGTPLGHATQASATRAWLVRSLREALTSVALTGVIDTRQVETLLGGRCESLCANGVQAGARCKPCDDGVAACLSIRYVKYRISELL